MIPKEILKNVRRIEIRTRRLVEEFVSGEYVSVFKGVGMEFSQVREYVPGDDIRTIDWNVTARMGHPFVKQFVEERELTAYFLVDVSGSGAFGTRARTKVELATEVAAVLMFSAIQNHDRVGVAFFTNDVEKFLPPRKGRSHVLRVVRELLTYRPRERGTDIAKALTHLRSVLHRRAVVFLLSDFDSPDFERALKVTSRRHDLIPIWIRDRREEELPPGGLFLFRDLESGEERLVDAADPAVREAHAAFVRGKAERLQALFRANDMEPIILETGEPYVLPIRRFFTRREKRKVA